MDSKNIKKNQKNKVVLSEPEKLIKDIKKAIRKLDYRVMENCNEEDSEEDSVEYNEENEEVEENDENTVSEKNMPAEFEAPIQETFSKNIDPFPFNREVVQPKKKNKSEDNGIAKIINNVIFMQILKHYTKCMKKEML